MKTFRRQQRNRKIFYLHTVKGLTYNEIRAIGPEYDLSNGSFSRIVKEVRREREGVSA